MMGPTPVIGVSADRLALDLVFGARLDAALGIETSRMWQSLFQHIFW